MTQKERRIITTVSIRLEQKEQIEQNLNFKLSEWIREKLTIEEIKNWKCKKARQKEKYKEQNE